MVQTMEKLAEKLEFYSAQKYHQVVLTDRVAKAVRYMHEYDTTGVISNRKLATIKNVIRACVTERMVEYNTSPASEHYWSC